CCATGASKPAFPSTSSRWTRRPSPSRSSAGSPALLPECRCLRRRRSRFASTKLARRSKRSPLHLRRHPRPTHSPAPGSAFAGTRRVGARKSSELSGPSPDRGAVLPRVSEEAHLRDAAQIAGRHVEGHETAELGHPQPASLDVHLLPPRRLD